MRRGYAPVTDSCSTCHAPHIVTMLIAYVVGLNYVIYGAL